MKYKLLFFFCIFCLFFTSANALTFNGSSYIAQDAFIDETDPTDTQGTSLSDRIIVYKRINDGSSDRRIGIMDITIPTEVLSSHTTLNKTELNLYLIGQIFSGGVNVQIYNVYEDYTWNANTITWDNAGLTENTDYNGSYMSFTTIPNSPTTNIFYTFNITAATQYYKNIGDSTSSILLQGSGPMGAIFRSQNYSNASHIPYVTYTYEIANNNTPVITLTDINGDSSAPYTTTNRTVNISFTTDDFDTCRWSKTDQAYTDMTFNTTGNQTSTHSFIYTSPVINQVNNFSIACTSIFNAENNITNNLDVQFTLNNNAPVISLVTIQPTSPGDSDNLTFTNTTTDADSDTIQDWSYRWFNGTTQLTQFNNNTQINSTYTKLNENWTVELRAYDGYDWSTPTNSSTVTIGDSTAPVITDIYLSASSGVNDNPFTIFATIEEANTMGLVLVEVNDTNGVLTNFSMSQLNVTGSTYTFSRSYTPGADGIYYINAIYAKDGSGNLVTNNTNLSYTESTAAEGGGGGGGGGGVTKKDCNIILSDDQIILTGDRPFNLQLFNNDTVVFVPNVILPSIIEELTYTIPVSTIQTGQFGEINFLNNKYNSSIQSSITITSSACVDITVPIEIRPSTFNIGFLDKEFFSIGGFSINNFIVTILGIGLGLLVAFLDTKRPIGTQFIIVGGLTLLVVLLFNIIF